MNLSLSSKGLDFIKSWEKYRAEVYLDEGDLGTIGYGHLIRPGENFSAGVDPARALSILRIDAADAESCVNTTVRITIAQEHFDALTSLCFNIGCGNFRGSTLLRKLNAVDVTGASEQFLVWNKVGGQISAGLVVRRKMEQKIFDTGEYINHV